MRHFVVALLLLALPLPSSAQEYATYEEMTAMFEGANSADANMQVMWSCRKYGTSQVAGVADLQDPLPQIGTVRQLRPLQRAATQKNMTDNQHIWEVRCEQSLQHMTPEVTALLGGQQTADTGVWYPRFKLLVNGEEVTFTDLELRRLWHTCQPFTVPGHPGHRFQRSADKCE